MFNKTRSLISPEFISYKTSVILQYLHARHFFLNVTIVLENNQPITNQTLDTVKFLLESFQTPEENGADVLNLHISLEILMQDKGNAT